jgi:group I intron endonuclease
MQVYKITNMINGKVYIGKTETTLERRWKKHLSDFRKKPYHLYFAMRKYGVENFTIETVQTASSKEQLNGLEQRIIAALKANTPSIGYNMTIGGDGGAGHTLSIEGRRKVSAARRASGTSWSKGKSLSDTHRRNIAKALKGNHNCLGRTVSKATRQKLSNNNARAFLGRHHSVEARQRISGAMKRRRQYGN